MSLAIACDAAFGPCSIFSVERHACPTSSSSADPSPLRASQALFNEPVWPFVSGHETKGLREAKVTRWPFGHMTQRSGRASIGAGSRLSKRPCGPSRGGHGEERRRIPPRFACGMSVVCDKERRHCRRAPACLITTKARRCRAFVVIRGGRYKDRTCDTCRVKEGVRWFCECQEVPQCFKTLILRDCLCR
jgi:hypothetical protein